MSKRLPLTPTLVVTAAIAVLISLGVWQLKRALWKEGLLARYAAAANLPPISWPTAPLDADQLPLFRYATGVCVRPLGTRAIAGENRAGEPGYVHIVDCATGAEGPGMSVQVGWSKNPNQRVEWAGGPVSGIIVPDRVSRMRLVAASAPPGLEPSAEPSPETASAITPAGHRMYAATWFALALAALIIYMIVLMKRGRNA
ncbi:MAG TPA: SURF1 family protein [Sphingomicrobium sp.]|jgi:cytochrome oxidase assembly protein ShyY1|nr:SURF1 family protein [Sphingomicrobium sp.]